jgi:nucleoside-diphosphate-sugar epimerase
MMSEQKETILVTGSSSSIGYPLAKRLTESFNVVGFDRRAPSHPPPSAECLYVDVTSEISTQRGLQAIRELHSNRLAAVIHLAAYYDFLRSTSPLYDEVTVQGTARLLRLLQDFEVEQFIFSSTELVHAPSKPGQRLNEDSPLDPQWGYPKSKVETEKVIHAKRGKIPAVILCIAGVYDDLCNSIPLAHQMQRVYERDITAYFFPGDVSQGRQAFVHNDDVLDAIVCAVERRHELPPEVTLLIGEPESPSFDELQRAFGRLIHGGVGKTLSVPRWFAKFGAAAGAECDIIVEGVAFPHPSLVNRFLRRGLRDDARLYLRAQHEAGQVQTLPFAALIVLTFLSGTVRPPRSRLKNLFVGLLGVGARWKFSSEAYVVNKWCAHLSLNVRGTARPRTARAILGGECDDGAGRGVVRHAPRE